MTRPSITPCETFRVCVEALGRLVGVLPMPASALVSAGAPMPMALGASASATCGAAGLGIRPLSCFTMRRCVASGSESESAWAAGALGAAATPPSVMSVATGGAEDAVSDGVAGWLADGLAGAGTGCVVLAGAAEGALLLFIFLQLR